MMKRLNKKGFSMVELLAAVAILGVLSAFAIVSVSTILDNADKKYYETQMKNMIIASQSYTQDNRNSLPKRIGDTKVIKLQDLQSRKYIGDIVDRSKNKCAEGSVTIFKYNKNDYSYSAYLKCGNKVFGNNPEDGIPGPKVDLSAAGNFKNPYFTYEINSINAAGNNNGKIVSYDYQIYSSSVLVKNSGSIAVSKASSIEKKTVSLKEYVPGSLTIVFTAVNEFGGTTRVKINKSYQDPDGPICGPQTPERTTWDSSSEVTISILCYPREDGSPCAREVFTQHFTEDAEKNYIMIVNEEGNKTKCDVNTYIDRTVPSKPIVVATEGFAEGTWRNKKFTLTVTSTDDHSGIAYYQYCFPGSDGVCGESDWVTYEGSKRPEESFEPGKFEYETTAFSRERSEKVAIRAVDRAGNKSAETLYQINIDKTAPVVSEINFDTSTRKLTAVLTDNSSKVSYYGLTTSTVKPSSYTDITNVATYNLSYTVAPSFSGTYYIWAKDVAGNVNDGSLSNISVLPRTYSVTYDANGGTGAPAAQSKIYGVKLTLSTTIPTRSGYRFLGWSTSKTATSATYSSGGSYTDNAAATLFAVWMIDSPLNSYKCANVSKGKEPFLLVYGGNCKVIDDGNGNWRIKFLTGGILNTTVDFLVDAFLVGGGGGGSSSHSGSAGGGGGFTTTTFVKVKANTNYSIVIGKGGEGGEDGENTTAFDSIAAGGFTAGKSLSSGGSGGSGGGGREANGGSNGSDGVTKTGSGGEGQGISTCEFNESGCSEADLYAGGGGGGNALGGAGGGGNGGDNTSLSGYNGVANTGGGGGGGTTQWDFGGGSGGSGIVVIRNTRSTSTSNLPSVAFDISYTGSYSIIDDGAGNWRIKFLTSGKFKSAKTLLIDAFLVGGGGGGSNAYSGGTGGGGGFTTTSFVKIVANEEYDIVIGEGGTSGKDGESTMAFDALAAGGFTGGTGTSSGGTGGSGGGSIGAKGGSDGSAGFMGLGSPGEGQNYSTREFGESTGKLYAGGGGGRSNGSTPAGAGGAGGGARGGNGTGGNGSTGVDALVNTGGGGGGGGDCYDQPGGTGGSGIVVIRNTRSTSTSSLPSVAFNFSYTGSYVIIDDKNGNWRIKFLTSGVFKSKKDLLIDAFLVGGGSGGTNAYAGGTGGSGGYTTTSFAKIVANKEYDIYIGEGGSSGEDGESTMAFDVLAAGGKNGGTGISSGGTGGSGGGSIGAKGGSDGSDGFMGLGSPGEGQETSTREFGESSGRLYAGGGGGRSNGSTLAGAGGAGGGARGGNGNGGNASSGVHAAVNTGGGGGGGGDSYDQRGGNGGSGIVVIRNTRSASTSGLPGVGFDFTYNGSYVVIDDGNGNWRIKFLTDGKFKINKTMSINAFLVGGGGGGINAYSAGAGGGGGSVKNITKKLIANKEYDIIIGTGGSSGENGTATKAFETTAAGGKKGYFVSDGGIVSVGGNGGSGGAGRTGNGGSNGSNGAAGIGRAGIGQGPSLHEFGDSSLPLYAGGGGGGSSGNKLGGAGGAGGGGRGGNGNGGNAAKGVDAVANTGGGGDSYDQSGGAGGSGIVIIRNAR